MTSMHGGQIAIVGARETDELGVLPDRSMIGLHAEAALNALADAGLTAADVDGVATAGPLPMEVSHHLGITPRWMDGTQVGGCSFMLHVRHAAAAIAAGAADVVLITHGESAAPGSGRRIPANGHRNGRTVRGAVRCAGAVLDVHGAGVAVPARARHGAGANCRGGGGAARVGERQPAGVPAQAHHGARRCWTAR